MAEWAPTPCAASWVILAPCITAGHAVARSKESTEHTPQYYPRFPRTLRGRVAVYRHGDRTPGWLELKAANTVARL